MPRRSGSASTIIASRAVAREPRVARYLREIGVDAARVSRSDLFEEIAKPPSRADANVCGREGDLPAVRRQRDSMLKPSSTINSRGTCQRPFAITIRAAPPGQPRLHFECL